MANFLSGQKTVNKLTLYQWMNVEYGIVKRQYKELSKQEKDKLQKEYHQYLQDNNELSGL